MRPAKAAAVRVADHAGQSGAGTVPGVGDEVDEELVGLHGVGGG
jgi:hypothetical protein